MKDSSRKFNIKGFQEVSLLEWEGKLTSILFLPGCNLCCPFCHAKSLIREADKIETVPFERIQDYLNKKRGWLDAVAITGGEPTGHTWLPDLIDEIKVFNLEVMLQTNGTYPERIKPLLKIKKLDYITMDIKAPFTDAGQRYHKATASSIEIKKIRASIDLIISSGIDYEFRTTLVPGLINTDDILSIAKKIKGAKKWCLQQFSPKDTLDPAYLEIKPYPRKVLEEMVETATGFVDTVIIRNE